MVAPESGGEGGGGAALVAESYTNSGGRAEVVVDAQILGILEAAGFLGDDAEVGDAADRLIFALYTGVLSFGADPKRVERAVVEGVRRCWRLHGELMTTAVAVANLGALVGAKAVEGEGEET